jgi:hypothetical protein
MKDVIIILKILDALLIITISQFNQTICSQTQTCTTVSLFTMLMQHENCVVLKQQKYVCNSPK